MANYITYGLLLISEKAVTITRGRQQLIDDVTREPVEAADDSLMTSRLRD
jgi:hypothetical protein